VSIQEAQRDEERTLAAAALLVEHFVDDGDRLTLIRRHRDWLMQTFSHALGYRLVVTDEVGRLIKRFEADEARSLVLPVRSATEGRRPIDERPVLDAQRIHVVCLICAVLERSSSDQVPLGELAELAAQEARELDLPNLDFTRRAVRDSVADAVAWLTGVGVLRLRAGQMGVFDDRAGEEAFYDINRRRLALLLADPLATATADTLADIVEELTHSPTAEGQIARLRHVAIRHLVEDPVVYRHDPRQPERPGSLPVDVDAAYGERRTSWDRTASALTGLDREARLEGTALIAAGREITDRPFPTNAHPKQLALLLLPRLCAGAAAPHRTLAADAHVVAVEDVVGHVQDLCAEHGEFWKGWDGTDGEQAAALADDALRLLSELGLTWVDDHRVYVLPAAHRYAGAAVAVPQLSLI
jgi:uncharacterized protein (TIGR02678 family)